MRRRDRRAGLARRGGVSGYGRPRPRPSYSRWQARQPPPCDVLADGSPLRLRLAEVAADAQLAQVAVGHAVAEPLRVRQRRPRRVGLAEHRAVDRDHAGHRRHDRALDARHDGVVAARLAAGAWRVREVAGHEHHAGVCARLVERAAVAGVTGRAADRPRRVRPVRPATSPWQATQPSARPRATPMRAVSPAEQENAAQDEGGGEQQGDSETHPASVAGRRVPGTGACAGRGIAAARRARHQGRAAVPAARTPARGSRARRGPSCGLPPSSRDRSTPRRCARCPP